MFKTLKVEYGANGVYIDVTPQVFNHCIEGTTLHIPEGNGACDTLFGDPLVGVLKHLKVSYQGITTIFAADQPVILNEAETQDDQGQSPEDRLDAIHRRLKCGGGDIRDTYPNQLMAVMFLKPHNKVLEIGAGIGRVTMVIASLLNNSANVVAMECNPEDYATLCGNRDANGFSFRPECAALSGQPTYQKNWAIFPEGTQPTDATPVSTIDWPALKAKHPVSFDTLVADCESSLYYIFQEFPDILSTIKMVILQNGYQESSYLDFVDHFLKTNKMRCIFTKPGGWGAGARRFYEVWVK